MVTLLIVVRVVIVVAMVVVPMVNPYAKKADRSPDNF